MLTEQLVCGVFTSPAEGGSTGGESNVTILDLHTYSTVSTFKRSSIHPNCLAVSPTHIFAAQSDKATINVYNRAKGNQEATVPLPEKLTALSASTTGGLVASGTDSGRLNVWETATGRYTSTDSAHLQKVTIITFDYTSNLILTGSADSNIMVWSVPHLLDPGSENERKPIRTLQHHQAEVTGIVCGKGSGAAGIAVTCSRDCSAIVWNPLSGTILRTFVFPLAPLCIALDPASRAFYTGFENGTIQQVDFSLLSDSSDPSLNPIFVSEYRSVPITPPNPAWSAETHSSAVNTLSLTYEGNYLVAGNQKGTVSLWDVATGHMFKTISQFKSSVSNIAVLPPTGFSKQEEVGTVQTTIVPPRYHNMAKGSGGDVAFPPAMLGFVGVLEKGMGRDMFNLDADFEAVEMGVREFTKKDKDIVEEEQGRGMKNMAKIEELDRVLRRLYDNYETASRKTWDEASKWRLDGTGEMI